MTLYENYKKMMQKSAFGLKNFCRMHGIEARYAKIKENRTITENKFAITRGINVTSGVTAYDYYDVHIIVPMPDKYLTDMDGANLEDVILPWQDFKVDINDKILFTYIDRNYEFLVKEVPTASEMQFYVLTLNLIRSYK